MFIKSKIQFFESKSQHNFIILLKFFCCLSSQRYNFLKANHNKKIFQIRSIIVVYQVKDTIFWKQITTQKVKGCLTKKLFIKSKIQFFESKSQQENLSNQKHHRCLSSQRYNFLKANHNSAIDKGKCVHVVYQVKDTIFWKQITTRGFVKLYNDGLFIKSKIQFFESKSQPFSLRKKPTKCCLSSQRYNFLKANHNF